MRQLDVAIASPGDATRERDVIERECHDWNSTRGADEGTSLRPRRGDRDGASLVGLGDAQSVVNDQLIRSSDILVGVFRARLGTPTERAISGAVEEIELMMSLGKPVHLFFSRRSVPYTVDTVQIDALRSFERRVSALGLVSEFKTFPELAAKVRRCLELDVIAFRELR